MRWKALFALQKYANNNEYNEKPQFKTRKYPLQWKQYLAFKRMELALWKQKKLKKMKMFKNKNVHET